MEQVVLQALLVKTAHPALQALAEAQDHLDQLVAQVLQDQEVHQVLAAQAELLE